MRWPWQREQRMTEFEHQLIHELKKLMTSLDNLTASINTNSTAVTGLTASVDAAVADIAALSPTDGQLAALQSIVDSNTAATNAQTARLTAAVTPPVAVPPPAPAP